MHAETTESERFYRTCEANAGPSMMIRLSGRSANFVGAFSKLERYGEVIPSASALDSVLKKVCNHRPIWYWIQHVYMLFRPRHLMMTTNETKHMPKPGFLSGKVVHTQRQTMLLCAEPLKNEHGRMVPRDVEYLVQFRMVGPTRTDVNKYSGMFHRRLIQGNLWIPDVYMGSRECEGYIDAPGPSNTFDVESIDPNEVSYPDDLPLVKHETGFKSVDYEAASAMRFYGTDWFTGGRSNYFAPLSIVGGRIDYPRWSHVIANGVRKGGPKC